MLHTAATSFEPIPNYTDLRREKDGYDVRYQINTEHPLHNDPLVDPRDTEFGFTDASSYYSKPNSMTGEKLPGVPDAPLLRLDVVRRLMQANVFLQTDPDVRDALGAPARIRIDDGLRPVEVQLFAYEVAWPMILRRMNPGITEAEIAEILPKRVAKPNGKKTPMPHLTGGAADVRLMNLETGEPFDRGYQGGDAKDTAFPDFHEGYHLSSGTSDIKNTPEQAAVSPDGSEVVLGRRILHFAMTKVGGLYVNPTEIWHYGKGDPLSEYVSGSHQPYYGIAELPDWYTAAMDRLRPN